VLLFLSFAPDDGEVAGAIASWLAERDYRICSRRGTGVDDPQVTGGPEYKISQADAFIAVMSPSFLASASCRRERVLALHREPPNAAPEPPYFIHVVEVRPTPYIDTGALRARGWVDMTGGMDNSELDRLRGDLAAGESAVTAASGHARREPPRFHNRESELVKVLDGLTGQNGQHFWRVIAPPQLGKSWFLDRIESDLEERDPGRWTVKLVDVREKPLEVRKSAGALLGMLFGAEAPVTTDSHGLTQLVGRLNRAGKFHLCLVDSAELLEEQTARTLRRCLSQIHKEASDVPKVGVRLTLIVASRGKGWASVSPEPRLQRCDLSEFHAGIVQDVLEKMAGRLGFHLRADQLELYAGHIHRLCEGLPALLYEYLNWIQDEDWSGLDRLIDDRQFAVLNTPYIERELLSAGSLFGPGAAPTDEHRRCVAEAVQILVPYRLYTRAHLSQHVEPDGRLHRLIEPMGWTMEKLLNAVIETDLLYQPQGQPWDVIYSPIRRLLCRYWYSSDANLRHAHTVAGHFVRTWGGNQTGWEQAVALVECLWHESHVLMLDRTVNPAQELIDLARQLSADLRESPGWTPDALRRFAVDRIGEDEELVEAARLVGVSIEDLMDAVGVSRP